MSDTLFTGVWISQRGSRLDITAKRGVVYGTFDWGIIEAGRPVLVDVQGRTQAKHITFNVTYPRLHSLTTWIGRVNEREPDALVLRTVWVRSNDDMDGDEQELLRSVTSGADIFKRKY